MQGLKKREPERIFSPAALNPKSSESSVASGVWGIYLCEEGKENCCERDIISMYKSLNLFL